MGEEQIVLRSLELYVNSELWDEGGSLTAAHMRFLVEESGAVRRVDYAAPKQVREMIVTLGAEWARKFLDNAIETLRAHTWEDTLVDAGENVSAFPGMRPLKEDDAGDFAGWDLYRRKDHGPEPVWVLRLVTEDGKTRETAFYHRMHDEPQGLFWALMELFEPDGDWIGTDE